MPTFDEATYTTFDGEEVPLSSVRGTPTVVNFFSSTCTPCITEMPAFEEVYQEVGGERGRLPRPGRRRSHRRRPGPRRAAPGSPIRPPQDKDASVITALGGHRAPDHRASSTPTARSCTAHDGRAHRRRAARRCSPTSSASLVIDAPLGLAFAPGMVATVNPCGFAMLPAYLGYFLGLEGQGQGRPGEREPVARRRLCRWRPASSSCSAWPGWRSTTCRPRSTSGCPWATIVIGDRLGGARGRHAARVRAGRDAAEDATRRAHHAAAARCSCSASRTPSRRSRCALPLFTGRGRRHVPPREPAVERGGVRRLRARDDARAAGAHGQPRHGQAGAGAAAAPSAPLRQPRRPGRSSWSPGSTSPTTAGTSAGCAPATAATARPPSTP